MSAEMFFEMPDGTFRSIDQLIEDGSGEKCVFNFQLEETDLIAVQYEGEGQVGGYTFEINEKTVRRVNDKLTGRLRGYDLPEHVQEQDATFIGGGWGGSALSPGYIATGRMLYFGLANGGEYIAPLTTGLEVFRKDENGDYQSREELVHQSTK
jgi:hypothetical protein